MMVNRRKGPADNASYMNDYHFKDKPFATDDSSSLNIDPEINSTIKKNPYRSNVEIEGKEIVLKPDLSALFRAVGKKHSRGGMDVQLEPNSFIFSDDKSLAFNEHDHELMELKKGGNFKAQNNTPAQVLKRNVDPKHYNTLINNISDIEKDDLAKKTSSKMLEKYIGTIGNIAFLQEQQKGFPQGAPSFSIGTAPVYNADLKDEIMQQKQYAKYGGKVLSKYQSGGAFPFEEGMKFSKDGKNYRIVNGQIIDEDAEKYNMLPVTVKGTRKTSHLSGVPPISGVPPESGVPPQNFPPKKSLNAIRIQQPPIETYYPTDGDIPTPGTVAGGSGVKTANWEFTPWQKVSQLYNIGKYASLKRYMPMRSHLNSATVDPNLVNPEQVVGDMQGAFNKQTDALNTLNPILRNAQASAAYGDLLDKTPGVRSQYDNQNVGIQNQFKQYNNQIINNQRGVNMQNDQNYYKESVVGQQNFDNMKGYLGDQAMNNVLRDVETNQSLAYELLTQKNPRYGFNFRTGNGFTVNNKDIRDAQSTNGADIYGDFMKELSEAKTDQDLQKLKIKADILKQKNIIPYLQNLEKKKGGIFRPKN